MNNIGIDFGSTYTTVAVYHEQTGTPVAKGLTEGGSPFVPSVLTYYKNKTLIGKEAKKLKHKAGARSFRGFKMMLAEDDPEQLKARGFTDKESPYEITRQFLQTLLERVLERDGGSKVDRLVIGVPEIWNMEFNSVDGRARLRDICRSLPMVNPGTEEAPNIQVVSEPAAASAYFAHNFQLQTGGDFDGQILLIDYGGGTLDITLTQVEPRPDSAGNIGMEISVLYRTGAGENEEKGKIGQAGIVYMETVMRRAIEEAFPELEVPLDTDFYRAVDDLEEELQDCSSSIRDIFTEYGTDTDMLGEDYMDEDDALFAEIYYGSKPMRTIPVTYQLLARVYDEVIRGVFEEKLNEVIAFMEKNHIDYNNRNNERFKIVLVGGFGNYSLVHMQVMEKFAFSSTDSRQSNIIKSAEDNETAISLGAALLASGAIRIRNTAPFSIGVAVRNSSGRYSLTYGLRYNQDINFNEIYWQKDREGNPVYMLALTGGIQKFLLNTQSDDRQAVVVTPKEEFRKLLAQAVEKPKLPFVVGFSLDSSGVITLHVQTYDILRGPVGDHCNTIELTSIRSLFDIQTIERAYEHG